MYHSAIAFYFGFDFGIHQGPRKAVLDMGFNVGEIQTEILKRIRFGFNVMFNQVRQAGVEPLSSVGRLMAERTTQSWTSVPHFFVIRDVDAAAFLADWAGPKTGDCAVN